MTTKHTHRTVKTLTRGYRGTVANPKKMNPAAAGGVLFIDVCRCGATKETNSNGRHVERGGWVDADKAMA